MEREYAVVIICVKDKKEDIMGKGKKFLSLFLAAALAVTGISVGAPVTVQAAAEMKAAQNATVDLVLEHFEGSGGQTESPKIIISAKGGENAAGTAHNAAFVQGAETEEGTTFVSDKSPSYFNSGGRVAAVQFKIADGLTEESIGEAVLKIKFAAVSNVGDGKMRLGVFETAVQEFAVTADKDAVCTEGDKAFPAVNNDYTYGATMWSNFLAESGSEQIATVDVTKAVKNAVKKGQNSVVLRLQVPTGGGRMLGVMAASAAEIPADGPTLTVTRTTPVTVKYVAVSGDDAKEIKAAKQVLATISKDYTYEVPENEKVITADDGTGIVTYEYVASDPETLAVTADDGTAAARNVITLKYKEKLADKAALTAKINEVKNYAEANYTPETWTPFKEALDRANQVAASKYATEEEVAEALGRLTAAAENLALSDAGKQQPATAADKAALASYITDFEARVTGIAEYEVAYPQAARTAFDAAVAQVKAKTITTLKDIEEAKAALKTAEATLKAAFVTPYDGKAADIQELDAQIQAAQELLTDENKAKNEAAYITLKTAKETAEEARNTALTTEVTEEQVTGATATLKAAIDAFKEAIAGSTLEITGVKLDKTTLSVAEGKTAKLVATINPVNATTDKTLTWTSDKQDIAKVDQNGTVTGVKAGTARITVTTKNGKTASCTVTVTAAPTSDVKVSLDRTVVILAAGKNVTLKATVSPVNAGTATWTSSNEKVATVKGGKVTAKTAGTAKITAAVGNKTATCTVTVVSLSKTKLTLGVKEKITLKVNGTKKKVTWTTSNKKVATVTNGKIVAKKANKKAITITAKVDGVSLTCKVTVKAAPKKLILKSKKTITVKKKKTAKIKVSLPKNTAGTLNYKTSNKKVATVDSTGKVKGIKKGTAKITVTAANNKKAKVTVTVKVK